MTTERMTNAVYVGAAICLPTIRGSSCQLARVLDDRMWGNGIRGLMRGMATLPQGNQELLVVQTQSWKTPGELGVSKSMECDIFPFSALTLLVG